MNNPLSILILHRVPFENVGYDNVIDHQFHNVTYIGLSSAINSIPPQIHCSRVIIESTDDLVEKSVNLCKEENKKFDHVIAVSEYQLYDAANIRHTLNIPGPKMQEVKKVRDKVIMKKSIESAGLDTPKFSELTDVIFGKEKFCADIKLILKPKDGASSENVIAFDNIDSLLSSIHRKETGIELLDKHHAYEKFEVEEFITGSIIHIDGIVENSLISELIVSRYEGTCLAFAEGQAFGSYQIDMEEKFHVWAQSVIHALNIKSGAFHLEGFESGGRLVFLEIGHRAGGANVVKTFELATGINLHQANIATQLDLPIKIKSVQAGKNYGWFVFPGHHYPWTHCRLSGHEKHCIDERMLEWNQLMPKQQLTKNITYQKKEVPAAGIIHGNNTLEVQQFMQLVLNEVKVLEHL
ncbi:hypothetical protein P0Y67_08175 [Photobacterium sp. SP02]|uniref:ATP-grasp domain-containing protein n=1 Tax=Photobacterium sp. SP02 TaxID=3032280 RepID=UPI003145401F